MPPCFSVTQPPVWIALCLLLVLMELSVSLLLFSGEFLRSDKVSISPFQICETHFEDGTASGNLCDTEWMDCWQQKDFFRTVVIVCLYLPLVLVAFGFLAMALVAYASDPAVLCLGELCQGASCTLLLLGVLGFLQLYQDYVSWSGLTCWFYLCLGALLELVATTALTHATLKRTHKTMDVTII